MLFRKWCCFVIYIFILESLAGKMAVAQELSDNSGKIAQEIITRVLFDLNTQLVKQAVNKINVHDKNNFEQLKIAKLKELDEVYDEIKKVDTKELAKASITIENNNDIVIKMKDELQVVLKNVNIISKELYLGKNLIKLRDPINAEFINLIKKNITSIKKISIWNRVLDQFVEKSYGGFNDYIKGVAYPKPSKAIIVAIATMIAYNIIGEKASSEWCPLFTPSSDQYFRPVVKAIKQCQEDLKSDSISETPTQLILKNVLAVIDNRADKVSREIQNIGIGKSTNMNDDAETCFGLLNTSDKSCTVAQNFCEQIGILKKCLQNKKFDNSKEASLQGRSDGLLCKQAGNPCKECE